jgi:hypothetical protein
MTTIDDGGGIATNLITLQHAPNTNQRHHHSHITQKANGGRLD